MHWISNRLVIFFAVIAVVILASFDLALIVPSLFHVKTLPPDTVYLYLVLFAGSMVSVFAFVPILVYQFRQNVRLQDAVNHYVKNKMQEIMLTVDIVESNLVRTNTGQMTYEEKTKMLDEVRMICQDVSGNLAEKILSEAPTFNRNKASKDEDEEKDRVVDR